MYENVDGDNSIWIDCESGLMTYDEILATVEPGLKMFIHNFHLHFTDLTIESANIFQDFSDKVYASEGCSLHMSWKSENNIPVYVYDGVCVSCKAMTVSKDMSQPTNIHKYIGYGS